MRELLKVTLIVMLVLINAFFVACEFAMVKLRSSRIDTMITEGNNNAKRCKIIKDNLNSYLSACQLGITLCSLALGWMGESTVKELILPIVSVFNLSESIIYTISISISFLIITMMEVVIGELVPKALALYNTEKIMLSTSFLLVGFYKLTYPIIYFFNLSTDLFLKPFGYSQADEVDEPHTGDEIRLLVEESYKSGLIDESEQRLVDNIFEFEEKKIREIMVPRIDMVCIYESDSEEKILAILKEEGVTRYPVCRKNKDDILGFVHIRDLYNQKINENKIELEEILRDIIYISENLTIDKALERIRKEKLQLAIVVDEYGGTSGVVTIEDILEEIVGEIQDEFDKEETHIKKIGAGSYLVDGTESINYINKYFGLDIEHDGFDSIGGWISYMLGSNIKVNQSVTFENYNFTILELDKLRVVKLIIKSVI
ncbi:TPA: HlyC/CorC family transporter [Clostridioides difficile]|nr:HlyC/CorC family transporter [Clostridioides difficile]HBF5552111.1 HlyC/CorC family transporter [Clostridioides difficile]HBF5571101.1 HlyC/CorC family transporter [Clostridioides difficile]